MPGYCELKATLTPAPNSHIGVVYRLPDGWNGKLLGLGGGGWAGNVTVQAAQPGLKSGYATAQTDGGHPSTSVWDTSWASNPEAVKDFAYRAIHEMTVSGKSVVAHYYGKPQSRTYYQGCSTGGRMGLMEAQRFPEDYDGIIAGAPVYSLQVQTSALIRNEIFSAPGAAFSPAQLKLVQDAAVKTCDAKDGLKDGLIANPASCGFRPETLACRPNQDVDTCLAPAQIAAINRLYAGVKAPDGSWAAFPLMRGGEGGWTRFIATKGGVDATNGGGMIGLKPQIFGDRDIDLTKITPAQAMQARSGAFAKTYEATNPDLVAFVKHGGRLILWHGESDPGPSPIGTSDYYRAVQRRSAGSSATGVRLFMAPGVEHCGGGPGADRPDTLAALESWVEKGQAPQTVITTRLDGKLTRPLCPYPSVAVYKGSGDANAPQSYRCKAG